MGNVSPQFHCIYDDEFQTCKRDLKFILEWQNRAKLQAHPSQDAEYELICATKPGKISPSSGTSKTWPQMLPLWVDPWHLLHMSTPPSNM